MSTPADLARTLLDVTEPEYVRFVASWMCRAGDLQQVPALTGNRVVDALTAAAAAHVALSRNEPVPRWANDPLRSLERLWYPGPRGLFAHALVHSPLAFVNRGVLVEADSLVSV